MSKEKEKDSDELFFTPEHIQKFREEFSKFETEEAFFVAKKVITLDSNGGWNVLQFSMVVDDPITGLMAGDIPFRFYRRIQRIMEREDRRIEYAKQKQAEHYEKQGYPETGNHNAYAH